MKRTRPWIVLLFSLCVISIVTGCSTKEKNEGDDKMYQLNERQISICEQLNLPTSYDELDEHQQDIIKRIEELLQYLDKKYNNTFEYIEYAEKDGAYEEYLEAYSEDMDEYYATRVTVDEEGRLTDNYSEVMASLILGIDLEKYLNDKFDCKMKVFASDCYVGGDDIVTDIDSLKGRCSGSFTIIVCGKDHEEELKEYAEQVGEWYQKNEVYGYSSFIMVSENYYDEIYIENYKSVRMYDDTEISLHCDMTEDGVLSIY